jgi:soluble lytic murein transglycosylase-like protein
MDTAQTTPTLATKDGQGQAPAQNFPHVPDALVPLIEAAAKQYGIPVRLVAAIVMQESGGNAWAMRYEPGFFERYVRGANVKTFGAVSKPTEGSARATSWGLMQVMGETARCLGCTLPFLSALCEAETGLKWGCTLLMRLKSRHLPSLGWAGVVAAYNAGSPRTIGGKYVNQQYVDDVLAKCGGVWPPKE